MGNKYKVKIKPKLSSSLTQLSPARSWKPADYLAQQRHQAVRSTKTGTDQTEWEEEQGHSSLTPPFPEAFLHLAEYWFDDECKIYCRGYLFCTVEVITVCGESVVHCQGEADWKQLRAGSETLLKEPFVDFGTNYQTKHCWRTTGPR